MRKVSCKYCWFNKGKCMLTDNRIDDYDAKRLCVGFVPFCKRPSSISTDKYRVRWEERLKAAQERMAKR